MFQWNHHLFIIFYCINNVMSDYSVFNTSSQFIGLYYFRFCIFVVLLNPNFVQFSAIFGNFSLFSWFASIFSIFGHNWPIFSLHFPGIFFMFSTPFPFLLYQKWILKFSGPFSLKFFPFLNSFLFEPFRP